LPDFRIEPSQGSHFFQNLTSFNVGYINVDTIARPNECCDFAQLDALPAIAETAYMRHVHIEKPIEMYIDGFANKALIQF
jgi:hypothetical protein